MSVIPKLPDLYDEPFADSSQIPTFLVSELARRDVTVVLSGDGGDEFFGGYNRYFSMSRLWSKLRLMPQLTKQILAGTITSFSINSWTQLLDKLMAILPIEPRYGDFGEKLYKFANILHQSSPDEMYVNRISYWQSPCSIIIGANQSSTNSILHRHEGSLNLFEQMMYIDSMTYLPDDILVKVDRASMGVSLEARVPLLDHRIAELAWQIPMPMKIQNGKGKWIFREILARHVPRKLIERPKMGFGVPIDTWLRGPLRDWAENLLSEKRLQSEALLDPKPIRKAWCEHLSGTKNWSAHLWTILMFQAWLDS
jgi:asparagine synthase (glutamine-hydrolysing)